MEQNSRIYEFPTVARAPFAIAQLVGSTAYPNLNGIVSFYQMGNGTLVVAQVYGLPTRNFSGIMPVARQTNCDYPVFGFHIHAGSSCTGTPRNPFADAGGHYNMYNCTHPYHTGDLPPLFGNNGYALSAFYTEKFFPDEVLGRTVVIHDQPDDFETQPSGNSGSMIACGLINKA